MPNCRELANAIRILSMDAVSKANSGHPGMPMGMADIAEVLWNNFLKHNPKNPHWVNRDRFILSNGHGSMLQYALLHLAGYDVSMEDIQQFRQLHSKTPGHPEVHETPGVETTTGPLGQGLANGVGMAVAQKHLAAQFNRPGFSIIDHYIYVFVGDGCLMEGISHEVCSLAGTLGLDKLIVFYDDNAISIDGPVSGWFTDNTPQRFESYDWQVIQNVDGHDAASIQAAIKQAKNDNERPTLICCKTVIGQGAAHSAGTAKVHGAPLSEAEINATREHLQWEYPPFFIPQHIYEAWDATEKGKQEESAWQQCFANYKAAHPALAAELERRLRRKLPTSWQSDVKALIDAMQNTKDSLATRKASQLCIQHFTKVLPELLGGSADLSESNLTNWKGMQAFSKTTPEGQYLYYGVREFGMSAMMNGIALYGGLLPFGGTFLTFSDYARNAIRLAAMMRARAIFIYTHDSIGLGEDGPTHQPVEHLASLRLIPGLSLWRPADGVETAVAWQQAIECEGPTAILLSRQNLPSLNRNPNTIQQIERGGYVLFDCNTPPEMIMMATGSEVQLAVEAANVLTREGYKVRVVSMPSMDKFLAQTPDYQESVLPKTVTARIAIEAGSSDSWYKFIGFHGKVIGLDHFGVSAPAKDIFKTCGFTVDNLLTVAHSLMECVKGNLGKREEIFDDNSRSN